MYAPIGGGPGFGINRALLSIKALNLCGLALCQVAGFSLTALRSISCTRSYDACAQHFRQVDLHLHRFAVHHSDGIDIATAARMRRAFVKAVLQPHRLAIARTGARWQHSPPPSDCTSIVLILKTPYPIPYIAPGCVRSYPTTNEH